MQLTQRPEWKIVQDHRRDLDLRTLFADDQNRADRYSIKDNGLVLDYSKNLVNEEILQSLINLAHASDIESWREAMFAGEKINNTEDRAVLHTALRRPKGDVVVVDGENVIPYIHDVLEKIKTFSQSVRSGQWLGYTGKSITDIVSIGIGGSDLGPAMVCDALKSFSKRDLKMHFVSNIDGTHLAETLRDINPETTLFIIASKTFTTQETIRNACSAKEWFLGTVKSQEAIAQHFVALSTNEDAVRDFGIDVANMFPFKDWVGGRYSLWSAIGLPIALSVGYENFENLLSGAHAMDQHFRKAPLEENMPVVMAMLGVLYRNAYGFEATSVHPYDQYLHKFPEFLQQLDMESNGKAVDRDGQPVNYSTGPIVFGAAGTNGQHSFYQLIHQSPDIIPCDFIIPAKTQNPIAGGDHHKKLVANVVAQSQALAFGQSLEEAGGKVSDVFLGNRPSNTLVIPELNPFHLGQIIALYEHKIFVQGIIWNLNSYDQPGVQLGKKLAGKLLTVMDDKGEDQILDSSTRNLLNILK